MFKMDAFDRDCELVAFPWAAQIICRRPERAALPWLGQPYQMINSDYQFRVNRRLLDIHVHDLSALRGGRAEDRHPVTLQ